MKQLIERNIKFWFEQTQKVIAVMLLFGIGYSIFFNLILDQDMSYMMMIALIFPMIVPMTYITSYVPMVISFGSTRREAAWGFQIMNILSIMELFVVNYLHYKLFGEMLGLAAQNFTVILISMIFAVAVGQILGSIALKYGSKAYVVVFIVMGTIFVSVGIVIAFVLTKYDSILNYINLHLLIIIAVIACLVLYGISILVLNNIVKRYEVRYV